MLIIAPGKTPRDRVVEIEAPRVGFEGIVTVQLGRNLRAGDKNPLILREWQFKNLIVDAGIDQIMNGSTAINQMLGYLAVGTNSTAPAASDTGLGAEVTRVNSNGGFADTVGDGASFEYRWLKRTRLFLEAEGNGNLTECGFFKNAAGAPMWMRQLFKDSGGTPTTIIKTAADQLRVIYELRVYPPNSDVAGTIAISATNYDYVHRAAEADNIMWTLDTIQNFAGNVWFAANSTSGAALETQTLGSRTQAPSGTAEVTSSVSYSAYVNGNFYRDATHIWEPSKGNFTLGVGATTLNFRGDSANTQPQFQTSWTPRFSKDNTKRLTLVTRVTMSRYP